MSLVIKVVVLAILLALLAGCGYVAYKVITSMTGKQLSEQLLKVREWLLWAVTAAEKELGGGTGALKLRQVYDMFLQRFPNVAVKITFYAFSEMVDDVLVVMRKMLENNHAVKALVDGEESGDE